MTIVCDDRRQLTQRLAAEGLPFHCQKPTLLIVEQQSLAPDLVQQSFDLRVLKRNDLLLSLLDETADCGQQNVPGLEIAGHAFRRKSATFRRRLVKSSS